MGLALAIISKTYSSMNISLTIPLKSVAEEILEGCIRGERIYQKRLYELYYGKMMSVCLRYAGNRDQAQDLLNEGFMKVFTNIHKYKPKHSLESWIRRIMINNAIDNYRKNKKHRNQQDIDHVYDYSENETVTSQLSAEEILKLVQKLPPAYRTAFNLYAIEGFTHREISEKLGISEGTSKSNLSKARGKLKQMIMDLDGGR